MTHRTVSNCLNAHAISALAIAGFMSSAHALSLGVEQVTSTLGQPLRMIIPLLGSASDSLETRCFRVVAPSRSDGLPVVMQARIELQTTTNPPQLVVRSVRSIDEPILRISIEAGCDAPIRRDYTVLLDPPKVPAAEAGIAALALPQASPTAPERMPAATGSNRASPEDKTAGVPERGAARRAASASSTAPRRAPAATSPRDRTASARAVAEPVAPPTATAKQLRQDRLEVQGGAPATTQPVVADASLAALAVPRLRIASDLSFMTSPGAQTGASPVDELQAAIAKDRRARLLAAPIESDLAPRLEADLVVAQRRLAELQSQLAAAGMTARAAAPAGSASVTNALIPSGNAGWNWRSWIWVPGLLLVVGLVGFLLRQRRTQAAAQFSGASGNAYGQAHDDEITVVRAVPARQEPSASAGLPPSTVDKDRARPLSVATVLPTAPQPAEAKKRTPIIATRDEREASDRLNNPLFQLSDTESHVDVTELSQVTDEAQVYLDLGRNDQAIEILRDHIDAQTGELTSPAPWLMIFELYRRTNNRDGYDELAPQFRRHFNGRVPDWENYGHELALDDGLEAFPHLIARIERDWGTSEARKFLEELLYDNRGGSRLGFSLAAYRDILLLLQVHEGLTAQPDFLSSATDWESRGANDSDGTPKWDLSLEMIEPPKSGELESFLNRPPPDKT